ncbi:hypothetical protein JKP88DRAFT_243106 [Tribonema minus]|uniref:Uncharacterized protein n=1 Tax=Tribonema minus TaxID=303371 RepID=A0A835ZCC7_9STRA|nr:hypothetical protein JKP88DRAFT_243106 [Tribonema minus]
MRSSIASAAVMLHITSVLVNGDFMGQTLASIADAAVAYQEAEISGPSLPAESTPMLVLRDLLKGTQVQPAIAGDKAKATSFFDDTRTLLAGLGFRLPGSADTSRTLMEVDPAPSPAPSPGSSTPAPSAAGSTPGPTPSVTPAPTPAPSTTSSWSYTWDDTMCQDFPEAEKANACCKDGDGDSATVFSMSGFDTEAFNTCYQPIGADTDKAGVTVTMFVGQSDDTDIVALFMQNLDIDAGAGTVIAEAWMFTNNATDSAYLCVSQTASNQVSPPIGAVNGCFKIESTDHNTSSDVFNGATMLLLNAVPLNTKDITSACGCAATAGEASIFAAAQPKALVGGQCTATAQNSTACCVDAKQKQSVYFSIQGLDIPELNACYGFMSASHDEVTHDVGATFMAPAGNNRVASATFIGSAPLSGRSPSDIWVFMLTTPGAGHDANATQDAYVCIDVDSTGGLIPPAGAESTLCYYLDAAAMATLENTSTSNSPFANVALSDWQQYATNSATVTASCGCGARATEAAQFVKGSGLAASAAAIGGKVAVLLGAAISGALMAL